MTRAFGTRANPGNFESEDGSRFWSGSFQENHTIPKEVFAGSKNQDFDRARDVLSWIGFDGEDVDRNANWAPANERDALIAGSAMLEVG